MDYKNILEGTRPFFQGLPLPGLSQANTTPSVPSPTTVPLPLSSPLRENYSREREMSLLNHHHHLLNQHHQQQLHRSEIPSNNNNNSNSTKPSKGSPSSHSVIKSSSGSPGRSSSSLGHLAPQQRQTLVPIGSSSPSRSSSGLPHISLPQLQDTDTFRSKFAEGLGATLSQMYAGGHSGYSSTLNLTRTSSLSHLSPTASSGGIPSGSTPPINNNDSGASERQTSIIHSTTTSKISKSSPTGGAVVNNPAPPKGNMVGVRRESPLDLSVKTVRQSADSSTSSLNFEQAPGATVNGTRSSSGASTPNMLLNNNSNTATTTLVQSATPNANANVIAAVANSTTNERSRPREKTPTGQRYPSPHHQRQQSPSSSSLPPLPPMHQRVANLNLSIPTPTPPPRTGSGSSVASSVNSMHNPQVQTPTNPNHHLLSSHYPQASPGVRNNNGSSGQQAQSTPVGNVAGYHHPHYGTSAQPQQHPPSRPSSVIPPYNPPLNTGLASPYHPVHHHQTHAQSPYQPQIPAYPQYHPQHFQQGQPPTSQSIHPYYQNYPHLQPQLPPKSSSSGNPPPPTSNSSGPVNQAASYASQQQPQSKLSHQGYAPPTSHGQGQQVNSSAAPPASSYYHPSSGYYGPPVTPSAPQSHGQSRTPVAAAAQQVPPPQQQQQPQQHPGYYGAHSTTPYSHYPHISYPTYLPSNQRTSVAPSPVPNQSSSNSNYPQSQPPTNFQPHPGLRPTTPTGPPPPLPVPGQYSAVPGIPGQQYPQQPMPSDKSASASAPSSTPNSTHQSPMKPPEIPTAIPNIPKPKGSRKNVLNMLRTSVESRMHEKQEKEKFQFNHQTWNFHGRKFNTSLPPLNSSNTNHGAVQNHSASLGSTGSGSGNGNSSISGCSTPTTLFGRNSNTSKYESGGGLGLGGSDTPNNNHYGSNTSLNNSGGSGGSGGSSNSNDISSLHRIRTKAEKKQLFPNLLSQIEQENSHKEAEKMLQNSHIYSRQDPNSISTSVFDFKEDDDDFGLKINIPQVPVPGSVVGGTPHMQLTTSSPQQKKPRSPKKLTGERRNSLPKKGSKAFPSSTPLLLDKSDDRNLFPPPSLPPPSFVDSSSTIQATKAVTKFAAEGSIDAFWAACDSFLDDLQSNPNSIKSRRGGLWQKLKSKSKPNNASSGPGQENAAAPTPTTKGGRGVRIRKNSTDEDSDFEVDEDKSEEEEEEDEEASAGSGTSDDSQDDSRSRSANSSEMKRNNGRKQEKEKKRLRRVIDSDVSDKSGDEEVDDKLATADDDKDKDQIISIKRKTPVKAPPSDSKSHEKGKKSSNSKSKADDDDGEDASDDDDDSNSRGRGGKSSKSKNRKNKTKSRRRSTRKRKTITSKSNLSDLDDEDATSRSSIGSVSESESGSGSYLDSLDSDDSSRSTDDNSDDNSSDDNSDSDGSLSSSAGSRKRKRKSLSGSITNKAKKSKRNKSARRSSRRHNNKGTVGKWGRSKSSDKKGSNKGSSIRRTRSGSIKNDDDDDENFEPKGNHILRKGKGRKRKLPKRNCAPMPGNGKLKDISGESEGGEGGSSGEEWIMRGDLTKKKRKIVFGDGSDFKRPGWEEELIDFKKKLRMPQKLIQVSKPSSLTMSPASSVTGEKSIIVTPLAPTPITDNGSCSSPAKSAKENKIPSTTPNKGNKRHGSTTGDKQLEPEETKKSTKVKGRPPKSASNNSPGDVEGVTPKGKGKKKSKALFTTQLEKKSESSESPLDDPTIQDAVERMKAAANASKKAEALAGGACAGRIKKQKSIDLPELPPPLPTIDSLANDVMGNDSIAIAPVTTTKKGFRRNKFKSGFDYIRKKKKIITNPDGSPLPPPPKRVKTAIEKNVTPEDIQIEIRGWVLNKGHGETALHRAARLGYPDVAAYCLEHEICSPNCKDNAGYTPLHETCIKGNLEVAKVLLAYGADPSQSAPGGIRPLHEACENGHVELVRLLISYGADPTLTTYGGQSPLELADAHESARLLLDQHINDVLGAKERPWEFKGSGDWSEDIHEIGFDATTDPPPNDPLIEECDGFEFEATDKSLPPLYKIKEKSPYYVLLNDVTNYLGVPREKFLRSNPGAETIELNSNDFLDEVHCCHLLGEKFNLNSSSDLLTLIKYDDRIKKMLNIESIFIK